MEIEVNDTIFVAVGKNLKESKSNLLWALNNFCGNQICLLHVHQPSHLVSFSDDIFGANKTKQEAIKAFKELERQKMHKLLHQYHLILAQVGDRADEIWIEMDNIEKGIIEMISKHNIRWLVMGAAADKHYSKKMTELKSKKAITVSMQAPISCHIWFSCKGCLIFTRNGKDEIEHCVSLSNAHEQPSTKRLTYRDPDQCFRASRSNNLGYHVGNIMVLSKIESTGPTLLQIRAADAEEDDESDGGSRLCTYQGSEDSTGSTKAVAAALESTPSEFTDDKTEGPLRMLTYYGSEDSTRSTKAVAAALESTPSEFTDDKMEGPLRMLTYYGSEDSTGSTEAVDTLLESSSSEVTGDSSVLPLVLVPEDGLRQSSAIILMNRDDEDKPTDEIRDRVERAKIDAETSTRAIFKKSVRRWKAEEVAMEAISNNQNDEDKPTDEIRDRVERAKIDAETLKRAIFKESVRRWKAEEVAMEAISNANSAEDLCTKEINQAKEMEESLAKVKQEKERIKHQCAENMKELQIIQDKNPILETRLAESCYEVKELEEKILSAVGLLISLKEKRDKLRIETRSAFNQVEGLRRLIGQENISLCKSSFFGLSFMEIYEATGNFDPEMKIGEGRYGSVYQGVLCHVSVAIKMLPAHASQGQLEFQSEVEALSRVRHPNLVMLIGACPEYHSLIYEYFPNGSLEDHLTFKNKTSLPWQTRIGIAADICNVLIFLHLNNPCIVHGNLKPSNILLDTHFVSKLGDLGISRLVPTSFCNSKIAPMGSFPYTDPEVLEGGELMPESDVYSFGVILLQLLTGRPDSEIVKDVKCALERENFNAVLDFSAGEWPLEEAKGLAYLGLRCCEKNRLGRPDLVSEVWSVLEPMKDSCTSSPFGFGVKAHRRVPSHFVCPIMQEVMIDPHIAADGFTYEAEAIEGWLNSGHNTSPMTNLKLENCKLIPNYALYYAIQEWQQQQY